MNTSFLVPVFSGSFNTQTELLCNARDLHKALQVGRKFATWIKGRIEEYGFAEGVDFIRLPNLASDLSNSSNGNNSKRGGQNKIEYHLILDMAKELAMVEKTEVGRQVRKYFIQCERERFAGTQNIATSNQNSKPDGRYPTLNKRQQYLIRQAVLDNVAETANTFHSVYKKLYTRFNVYRYQDILAKDFDEAIELLGGVVNPIDNLPVLPSINQNGRWLLVVRNNQIAEVKSLKGYICLNTGAINKLII